MNENIDEICLAIDSIDLKLDNINKQIKIVDSITSSFSSMDSFQSILEDNYKEFSNISRCISRFKSLNKVAKDGLLDDYDTIFRSLNTECEGLFEDMMSSFSTLNAGGDIKTVSLKKSDDYNNTISRLGDF